MSSIQLLNLTLSLKLLQISKTQIHEKMERKYMFKTTHPTGITISNNTLQLQQQAYCCFQVSKPSARSLVLQAYITISKTQALMTH